MLERFSLGQKLAILIGLPLLALSYFSVAKVMDNIETLQETNGVVQLDELTGVLANFMEDLTAERGTSVSFVLSQGKESGSQLASLREKTDAELKLLRGFLAGFNPKPFGPALVTSLESLNGELAKLGEKRQQVTNVQMSPDDVLAYYRNINRLVIATATEAAKTPNNAEVSNYFNTIVFLLKTIEVTGQQRSPLLRAFEAGSWKGLEGLHAGATS